MIPHKPLRPYEKIGTVAALLDLPQHVIRFWEARFPQVAPLRRGSGEHAKRHYRREDIELLNGIRFLLHAKGYSIKGVQRILKERGAQAVRDMVLDAEFPDY